jgi:hypothetical protein
MTRKVRVTKVEDALIAAHRNRPEIETGVEWNRHVMEQVRAQGRLLPVNQGSDFAQRCVWRFATVTCMLALAFSLYALQISIGGNSGIGGIGLEQLALNLVIDDPLVILQAIPVFAL